MSEIGPETIIQQSDDAISREISGKTVILTPSEGTIHELDELGCFIWGVCSEPISIEDITAKIVAEYNVEAEVAQRDTASFLAKLIDVGAVITQ